jgi:tetratricopeptide (TPR) repeat protein
MPGIFSHPVKMSTRARLFYYGISGLTGAIAAFLPLLFALATYGQSTAGDSTAKPRLPRPSKVYWFTPGQDPRPGLNSPGVSSSPVLPALQNRVGENPAFQLVDKTKVGKLDLDVRKLSDAGEYKKAFELLEGSTKEYPGDGHLWFNQGLMAERIGKWHEARDCFDKAGSLIATLKFKSRLEQARICLMTGEAKKGVEWLWELLNGGGLDNATEKNVEKLLIESGDERAASIEGMVAAASDSELSNGAVRAERAGRISTAVTLARALENRNSYRTEAQSRLASVLFRAGKYSEALPYYRRAEDLDQNNPDRLIDLLRCCTQLGLLEDIQALRQKFVARFPDDERSKTMQEQIDYYSTDFSKTRSNENQVAKVHDSPSFSKSCMPLRVYVPDFARVTADWTTSPDPDVDCTDIFLRALADWNQCSSGKVSFQNSLSKEEANISVEWAPDSAAMKHSFAVGQAGIETNSRGMPRASIILKVPTGRKSGSSRYFYETCAHEIGHALGLWAHSSDPHDIMYFSELSTPEARSLSENDSRRINELYKNY